MEYTFEISFWFQFGVMCVVVGSVTALLLVLLNIESASRDRKGAREDPSHLFSDKRQCCGLPSKRTFADAIIKTFVGKGVNVGEAAPATPVAKIALFLLDALFLTLIGNLLSVLACDIDSTTRKTFCSYSSVGRRKHD